jgi:hypothetical protein
MTIMKKIILLTLFISCFGFRGFAQHGGADASDFQELIDALIEGVNTGMESRGSGGDLADAPTLSETECVPDFSQDLGSGIMVSCNEEPTCIECFEKAYTDLNFYRRQLARMRCIYNNTKTFKESAVAFGDNTSGIHAMAGIAWQQQRANIMNSYKNMQKTYDTRSVEFLKGLQKSLKDLSTCMYISGENNWYAKSGFIYFEFMQERYKRPD